jgi:hypothetical protein
MHCISLVALFATLAASPVAAADLTSQVVRTRDAVVSDSTSLEVRRVRPKAVIVSNPQDVYWSAENESVFD